MSASLVVPSRGGAARLPVLFAALERQTTDDFEVIVVLDGDIDDSAAVVDDWIHRLPVRAIEFPENRGRSKALNEGFRGALGEVLIRCDDDLEPGPNHIALHVAHHHRNDGPVGVIGLCPNVFPDTPYARVYGRSRDQIFRSQAYAMPVAQRWRLWGANVSVTRKTYDRVGAYDTAYRAYGMEDVDWGYRAHKAGIPIVLDERLEARHHGAATTSVARTRRAFHSGAAQATFRRLHGAGVLDGPSSPEGAWARATEAAGTHLSARGVERMASLADRAATFLPRAIAEKGVAFAVESAAIAGRRQPGNLDLDI
jgi:glycosyltransferase involved in cell wall biosynthesis